MTAVEFLVEDIFPVSFQPVPFLWGTLKGDLHVGDDVFMETPEGQLSGKVTTIGLHKPPDARADQFSIAISGDLVPFVTRGSVIRKGSSGR